MCCWSCHQAFRPDEFRLEDRGEFFHAECWFKKLLAIGSGHVVARPIKPKPPEEES